MSHMGQDLLLFNCSVSCISLELLLQNTLAEASPAINDTYSPLSALGSRGQEPDQWGAESRVFWWKRKEELGVCTSVQERGSNSGSISLKGNACAARFQTDTQQDSKYTNPLKIMTGWQLFYLS